MLVPSSTNIERCGSRGIGIGGGPVPVILSIRGGATTTIAIGHGMISHGAISHDMISHGLTRDDLQSLVNTRGKIA